MKITAWIHTRTLPNCSQKRSIRGGKGEKTGKAGRKKGKGGRPYQSDSSTAPSSTVSRQHSFTLNRKIYGGELSERFKEKGDQRSSTKRKLGWKRMG